MRKYVSADHTDVRRTFDRARRVLHAQRSAPWPDTVDIHDRPPRSVLAPPPRSPGRSRSRFHSGPAIGCGLLVFSAVLVLTLVALAIWR
jgi:hypothetical protein